MKNFIQDNLEEILLLEFEDKKIDEEIKEEQI